MKAPIKKSRALKLVPLMLAVGVVFASGARAQESDDAMADFMNGTGEEIPASKDAPSPAGPDAIEGEADVPGEVVEEASKAPSPKVAPKVEPKIAQPNPALDKLEATIIGEPELKAFMKAGGLRSRKLK